MAKNEGYPVQAPPAKAPMVFSDFTPAKTAPATAPVVSVAPPPLAVPRIVKPGERASAGLKRFRIRTDNVPGPTRYVLAPDLEAAKVLYRSLLGPDHQTAALVVSMMPD